MIRFNFRIFRLVIPVLLMVYGCNVIFRNKSIYGDRIGVNNLKPDLIADLDSITNLYRNKMNYARVGIVYKGVVVFTKSYIDKNIDKPGEWASISKPATAMIVMKLAEEGYIKSIDDNIWVYSSKYTNCMPEQYSKSNLTIKHLLMHQGGVLYAAPLWNHENNKLILQFEPGTNRFYSSGGYGIIGDVIRAATGKSFSTLVEEYIGDPVGANSITAREQIDSLYEKTYSDWQSPASFISSTIEDIAKFSAGVMNNRYLTSEIMINQILKYGLGWNSNTQDGKLYSFHTGNNGRQKSVMINNMDDKISVSILFSDHTDMTNDRMPWARALLNRIETYTDPLVR